MSEKGEVLLRGFGTLRCVVLPNASVQWQPGDLTIHTDKRFLGAGFLGAPPISLQVADVTPALAAWNQARLDEGACPTQRIEVGDRLLNQTTQHKHIITNTYKQ